MTLAARERAHPPVDDAVTKAATRYRRSRRLAGIGIGALLLTPGWALAAATIARRLTGTHPGTPWTAAAILLAAAGTLGYAAIFGSRAGAQIRERLPYDRVDDLAYHYLRVRQEAAGSTTAPPPELLAAAGRAARRLSVTCPHSSSRLKAAMLAQRYFDNAAGARTPARRRGALDLAETLETTHHLLASLRPV